MKLLLAILLSVIPCFSATVIDSGSSSDMYYFGGTVYTITGSPLVDSNMRFGPAFSYSIPAAGDCTVTLRFVEPNQTTVGSRVFSVAANGVPVISNLDLVAIVGPLAPYSRTFQASPINGFINLAFTTQVRSAVISSIELVPIVIAGPMGPQGPQGIAGAQGIAGPPGAIGVPGSQGPMGPQGQPGSAGSTGPQGIAGIGTQGTVGPQGSMGPQGPAGSTGAQGIAGTTGTPGIQGPMGPQGPPGTGGSGIVVDAEVPLGTVDGTNAVFSIAAAPSPAASLHLWRNGLRQKPGFDFDLSGKAITFVPGAIPQPGDTLLADYRQ